MNLAKEDTVLHTYFNLALEHHDKKKKIEYKSIKGPSTSIVYHPWPIG